MTVNINAEIETIRNAPYARDVRDAIADSLKQMMDVAGNEAKFESYVTAVTDQFLQDLEWYHLSRVGKLTKL